MLRRAFRQGIRRREEEYQRGAEEDPASRRRAGSSERRAGIPTKRSRIPAEFADQMSRAIRQPRMEYPQATSEYKSGILLLIPIDSG